jgi:hypothetical protein
VAGMSSLQGQDRGLKRWLKGGCFWAQPMNLEPKHNWAIREEIGDRLRALLSREEPPLPPRLHNLLDRFYDADGVPAGARRRSRAPRGGLRWLQASRFSRRKLR